VGIGYVVNEKGGAEGICGKPRHRREGSSTLTMTDLQAEICGI